MRAVTCSLGRLVCKAGSRTSRKPCDSEGNACSLGLDLSLKPSSTPCYLCYVGAGFQLLWKGIHTLRENGENIYILRLLLLFKIPSWIYALYHLGQVTYSLSVSIFFPVKWRFNKYPLLSAIKRTERIPIKSLAQFEDKSPITGWGTKG